MDFLDEKIVASTTTPGAYGLICLNPDGSNIGGGSVATTTYDLVMYVDNTDPTYKYEYVCESATGTAKATAEWRIKGIKTNKTTGEVLLRYANGTTGFTNAATDLATVSAYTYLDF